MGARGWQEGEDGDVGLGAVGMTWLSNMQQLGDRKMSSALLLVIGCTLS